MAHRHMRVILLTARETGWRQGVGVLRRLRRPPPSGNGPRACTTANKKHVRGASLRAARTPSLLPRSSSVPPRARHGGAGRWWCRRRSGSRKGPISAVRYSLHEAHRVPVRAGRRAGGSSTEGNKGERRGRVGSVVTKNGYHARRVLQTLAQAKNRKPPAT